MSKFSFLSWNVRHFKGGKPRLNDVDKFITELEPDVFGLIEYQGKSISGSIVAVYTSLRPDRTR